MNQTNIPQNLKLDEPPLSLSCPTKKYRGLGQEVGAAWEIGKKLIKK